MDQLTEQQINHRLDELTRRIEAKETTDRLDELMGQSSAFADSYVTQAQKQVSTYRKMAFVSVAGCLMSIAAVMGLTPLKTSQPPKILMMDKATASVSELMTVEDARIDAMDAVTKSALNAFVLARESYTKDTAELNYYTARAYMSPNLQLAWANLWGKTNPQNPFLVYKDQVTVSVKITSITPNATPGVATVRFVKILSRGTGKRVIHNIATIPYEFVKAPTDETLIRINPFGLQIKDYQVQQETSDGAADGEAS